MRGAASARRGCRHPPVTLIWRATAGRLWRRSMMKSWPLGLRAIASSMAAISEFVALRRAQRRAQIGGVLLAEAHIERAGAGDPHAIAALAEIVGQRRDEAEPPAGLAHDRHSAPGRRCGSRCRRASSAAASRARTIDSGRYWSSRFSPPISPIGMTSINTRSKPSIAAPGDQIVELVLVDALKRHRVDLDCEPGGLARASMPVEHRSSRPGG